MIIYFFRYTVYDKKVVKKTTNGKQHMRNLNKTFEKEFTEEKDFDDYLYHLKFYYHKIKGVLVLIDRQRKFIDWWRDVDKIISKNIVTITEGKVNIHEKVRTDHPDLHKFHKKWHFEIREELKEFPFWNYRYEKDEEAYKFNQVLRDIENLTKKYLINRQFIFKEDLSENLIEELNSVGYKVIKNEQNYLIKF